MGKSRPADSQTDGLDSPLGPEEIKAILQVVTVAFGTASAALVFFEKLHKLLHKPAEKPTELPSESPPVPVIMKDGRTGKRIAKIDKHSDPKELSRKAFK